MFILKLLLTILSLNVSISQKFLTLIEQNDHPKCPLWPNSYSVKFDVSIDNFHSHRLPSQLYYDFDNQRQAVIHHECPFPFLGFTECKSVFTNQGTFVVEYFGTKITPKIPICCKVMEFGTLRPNLFSDHSKWNSTFTCDNFLGNNRTCDSYNLFGHGSMWIDSETRDPVKFQADFPPPANHVQWDYTEKFQIGRGNDDPSIWDLPKFCLPKCPLV